MSKWSMVIDLDKCVACQACSIACRFENNTPAVAPDQAEMGRAMRWNDVFPMPINSMEGSGEYPNVKTQYMTRPCMHCENPPCIKVCPVGATFINEEGLVEQNYARCIGCRFCTVGCPYGVRYFNWFEPQWEAPLAEHLNPDKVEGKGVLEGPAVRPRGVVEKCTYCIHRLKKAHAQAEAEGRDFAPTNTCLPACRPAPARRASSATSKTRTAQFRSLQKNTRSFRLLEDVGTHPKTIYLREG